MYWVLALGVFVGNWLVVPLVLKKRSFKDGFFIGLISAVIVLGITLLLGSN